MRRTECRAEVQRVVVQQHAVAQRRFDMPAKFHQPVGHALQGGIPQCRVIACPGKGFRARSDGAFEIQERQLRLGLDEKPFRRTHHLGAQPIQHRHHFGIPVDPEQKVGQ